MPFGKGKYADVTAAVIELTGAAGVFMLLFENTPTGVAVEAQAHLTGDEGQATAKILPVILRDLARKIEADQVDA